MKKRIFTLVTLLMVIAMNMQMMAQSVHPYKAYAVYNEGSLTFYYDECYTSQTGTVYRFDVNNNYIEGREPMWVKKHGSEITTASFDESFADISLSFLCDMFANCTNLKTITGLENVNTSQVTNMAGMFYNCASLEGSLNLCDWNTGNVTDMNEMFYGCSNLTAIDVSGWNTEKVTSMESMFYNCNKLKRLNLSSWNTVKVTNMEWMFRDCSQLKYILCGDNWSVAKVTESDKMFGGCSSLVGGAGTTYNASHIDASYAHIDGGSNNPGYLRKPIRIGNSITINDFEWPTDFEPTDYDASTSTSGCRVSRVYYVQYMKEVSYPVGYANDNLTICFEIEATDGVFDTNPYPSAYIGDLIADGRMIKNEGIIVFSFPYQVPTPDGGKYIRSASASVTEPTVAESQAKAMNAAPAKARPEPTYTVSDPIWIEMKNGKPSFATSFVAGHQYAAALTFTAKDGNQWHPTKSVIYINGQQAEPIEVDDSNIFAAYSIILNSGKTGPLYNYQSAQTIMAAYIFPKLTEGISTGIHNGQKDSVKGQRDEWFTIDGQILSGRPSKKGVYIYNGKKAVIN